jgi:hypothetical protein
LACGWLAAGLMLGAGDVEAAVYSGNVTNGSTSTPKLNAAGTAWEPFSNAQASPNAGKSIKILFLPDDGLTFTGFPLNIGAATVQLRASTGGPLVTCTFNAAPPVLTAGNGGTCTYRTISTGGQAGDTIEIFYLGLLNGNIRYTIAGVTPAVVAGNSVVNFDSDNVIPGTPPAPAAPGTAPSRNSARMVLVYDKSGSMDWTTKPADAACGPYYTPIPACKRWEVLKLASAQMVSVAKAYALPGDELGVVFFDSTATDTGGIAAMTNVTLDAVAVAINARSPGGNTSIGAGVQRLIAQQLVDNADFNGMTLLFTDGEQNTPPFLVSDGTDLLINAAVDQPFGVDWAPDTISLCTFRLRTDDPAGPAGTTTLQQIADEGCDGLMNSAATLDALPADLIAYFLQVLHTTLIGDKLEISQMRQGTEAAAPKPPPLQQQFTTSRRDLSFTVLFAWDQFFQSEGRPALQLSKDGVVFNVLQEPNVLVTGSGRHIALTLRAPFCNFAGQCVTPDGVWTLRAQRPSARLPGAWAMFVLTDNETLASSYRVTQTTAGIGQPLQFQATLTEGGAPLAGLAAGSVRAFVQGPSQSLGNVLAASNAKPGDPPPGDPNTPAGLKAQAMLADPAQRAQLLAALELGAEQGIPLTESSPGVYTGTFPATLAEGIYRVTYRVEATSAGNAAFTRVFMTDRYVPVQPDDAATAKTMQIAPAIPCDPKFGGGCKRITMRPVDAAGNFVGPGKATSFAVGGGAEIVGTIDDQLDGTYSLVIGYLQPGTTAPPVSIGGLTLNLPQAAGPDAGGFVWRWWWIILLILLVILFVIWLVRRP